MIEICGHKDCPYYEGNPHTDSGLHISSADTIQDLVKKLHYQMIRVQTKDMDIAFECLMCIHCKKFDMKALAKKKLAKNILKQ